MAKYTVTGSYKEYYQATIEAPDEVFKNWPVNISPAPY